MAAELQIITTASGAAARADLRATRGEMQAFGRDTRSLGSESGRAQGRVGRLGSAVGTMAKSLGPLAAAAAGGAVLKFGADSIKAASDTEQAFGALDSVFGKNSARVKQWADDAASSAGLARSEYANMAAVLGASLKNTGIENYAGQTKNLIGLGADLAATFGGTTSDAVAALGSLLRGEADPIERYGVTIKQSGVNALLAARGQQQLTGKQRIAAEQQARLTLLMQQTAGAQGQARRESNTLASSQQRLNARWTNLKDTLGQKLLPVATRVVRWMGDTVAGTNRTGRVLRWLGSVYASYVVPAFKGLRDGLRKIIDAFRESDRRGGGFADAIKSVGRWVKDTAPKVGRTLGGAIEKLGGIIADTIRVVDGIISGIRAVGDAASSAKDKVGGLISKIGAISTGPISAVIGAIRRSGDATRSAPLGLARAAGSRYGTGLVMQPSFSMEGLSVIVQLDGRQFDGRIVRVTQGVLRELDRKDAGGYR